MPKTLFIEKKSLISGKVAIPGSKSETNRVLLMASLGKGVCHIHNILRSDDSKAMIIALKKLGVKIEEYEDEIVVYGLAHTFKTSAPLELFLGNAGTAMRPLCAALALSEGEFTLTGEDRMYQRPIKALVDALDTLGCSISYIKEAGFPPLKILGIKKDKLHKVDSVYVDTSKSSQFLTALLLVSPYLDNEITIKIKDTLISKPYIKLTLDLMEKFGVKVLVSDDFTSFKVSPTTYKNPEHFYIDADATSATYFAAAAAISGNVHLTNLKVNSSQGDINFLKVLEKMGAQIKVHDDLSVEITHDKLHGIEIDLNDMPDAAMTLVPLVLYAEGPIVIKNIASWKDKECNRLEALQKEISKLGVDAKIDDANIYLKKGNLNSETPVFDTYKDHRMAMTLSLCAFNRDIYINDPDCVNKTFPTYFDLFFKTIK